MLEIQNIWTLNHKIATNLDQDFNIQTIKQWHQILMSGVIKNAGEFSKKVRVIPATDLTLTHPDDIEAELKYWLEKYKNLRSLTDIAKSHSHFELIHPFSDGNGRIGRSIILLQCLRLGFVPPLINAQNKQMYYATLQHSQKYAEYRPLALFLQHNSKF
ncbi:MAG: Fic family protein [Candidatus Thioglobus sp.]|nr:MAG: Fic family protein [Candidatus Thioglobus sp.]